MIGLMSSAVNKKPSLKSKSEKTVTFVARVPVYLLGFLLQSMTSSSLIQ